MIKVYAHSRESQRWELDIDPELEAAHLCPNVPRNTEHEHILKEEQWYSGHSYVLRMGIKGRERVRAN